MRVHHGLPADGDPEGHRAERDEGSYSEALQRNVGQGWVRPTVPHDWNYEQLRQKLDKWEFHFMVAWMHYYVSDNSGLIEGMSSFVDNVDGEADWVRRDELIEAWKDIGYHRIYKGILAGEQALKKLGVEKYDDLTGPTYTSVLAAIEAAQDAEKLEENIDVVFYHYILKNTKPPAAKPPGKPSP